MLTIHTRAIGSRRPLLEDWSIGFPPEWAEGGDELTLRVLVSRIVRAQVRQFRERQEEQRFVRALTAGQIAEGAAKGRIDSGGRILHQNVDEEEAVGAALQAFEDGLYMVIVDEEQKKELDRPVRLRPDSDVSFIRLTMLAGG